MLIYIYFLFLFVLVIGQKQNFHGGNRYSPIPYYNLNPKPENGVGVLQDLSNARILSNEPFIISFEFPKLIGSGDSRKNRFGAKRTKSQRKKNRKPREFRNTVIPEEHILQRRKRLQILHRPPGLENLKIPNFIKNEGKIETNLLKTEGNTNSTERSNYGRLLNFASKTEKTENKPIQHENQLILTSEESDKMDSIHQKRWDNIKKKWISLFGKNKEKVNEVEGEDALDEDRIKALSRKMWANCQLLKLLKAPQRNPYFYKLLPPNYPAIILNEEKQLECKQFYDIIDLAKDKKMIEEKIDQLQQILNSENDSGSRRKREVHVEEIKSEKENTLQDETLQGKSEGEVRSDRSKRTKERQHIRRQRSKEPPKEKTRRLHRNLKKNASGKKEKRHERDDNINIKRSRRKDGNSETSNKKILQETDLKPEEDHTEKKREKQEIKTGQENNLQDVFSPNEVNKVIRQKEMEANIFDKVLRAMKKFEENNPYDESFRPQKRESGNETDTVILQKNDTNEEGWELEDTIKKLAKIFKVLGMKVEAAKKKAEESEESSSEELYENGKTKKSKIGKTPKCTCAECPFCQDCYQCFKECRKAALSAKNNQTPVSSVQVLQEKGLNTEKDLAIMQTRDSVTPHEERSNNVKLERMYRSKLPPSRDLVRVYFDNPENKLLVWTKRGRRTMPWGPLASDLQLYRDRARQILKSAEEILHRIRDTEEKLHTGEYDGNGQESHSDNVQNIKNMDDIIKKVVNEDETKNILKSPWEAELENGVLEGNILKSNLTSKNVEEETYNIFKDGIMERTELPKESLVMENVLDKESLNSYDVGRVEVAKSKPDNTNRIEHNEEKVEEENKDGEIDSKSIEAAVLPIEEKNRMSENVNLRFYENGEYIKDLEDSPKKGKDEEEEEEEDIPAKVEAVNHDNITVEDVWKDESKNINVDSQTNRKQVIEYIKAPGKQDNIKVLKESSFEVKAVSDELENAHFAESQSTEEESNNKSEEIEKSKKMSDRKEANNDESEKVEGRLWEDSDEKEKSNSRESEEVEKTFDEESAEREKSYNRNSQVIEKAFDEEKADKKSHSREEIEKEEELSSSESEEVVQNVKWSSGEKGKNNLYSKESEEVEKDYSIEKTEKSNSVESEEVEKVLHKGSGEKTKSFSGESEMEKEKSTESQSIEKEESIDTESVKKSYSSESEDVERMDSEESGETEESYSSESIEKVNESESMERNDEKLKLTKMANQKKTKTDFEENWKEKLQEKKDEDIIKELKKAVEIQKEEKILESKQKEDHEGDKVEKSKSENSETEEITYENTEEVEGKQTKFEEDLDEEDDKKEEEPSKLKVKEFENVEAKLKEGKNTFEDHIKSIEENYIIKGVKQTKEEKEAILKALLNVDKKEEGLEDTIQKMEGSEPMTEEKKETTPVKNPVKSIESNGGSLQTVVHHLERGHMDENDFEIIKKLDESQMDLLVGEMQKNDEKGTSVNCETRMKLCQAVCNCRNNGTDSDLNKYEIIKGFLGWLKDLKMEKMVPISV